MKALLQFTERGIFCAQGDFYIDPWKPVDRAVITHAHSDHARWGMKHYLSHELSVPVMKHRLGPEINVETIQYGESRTINGVKVSFHPAGHIPGSAQVRVEYKGQVEVATGDFKIQDDGLSTPFEAVKCHTMITESTFGLPIYRWKPQSEIIADVNDWWRKNAAQGVPSVVFAYALGKAQRIINSVDLKIGKIYTHGAVENTNEVLRNAGLDIAPTTLVSDEQKKDDFSEALIIATPSAQASPWMKRFGKHSTGVASGWMQVRGMRRRRNADRGFVLSDHADWHGLNLAVEESGAERVIVTHGYSETFAKHLRSKGIDAITERTSFEGESAEMGETLGE